MGATEQDPDKPSCGGLILRQTEKAGTSLFPCAGRLLLCGSGSSLASETRLSEPFPTTAELQAASAAPARRQARDSHGSIALPSAPRGQALLMPRGFDSSNLWEGRGQRFFGEARAEKEEKVRTIKITEESKEV
ncbi:hypothetical protein llap_5864 [Limosa lapponica baueri]|uniref:Uncharacterized protein n=1 Tax=Limosa lapponica baueri TaxID=1758121 RepID=A0A2I0UCS6_LIMLA|nr:hypothetical protein llap_5864 [Limosa lapponica baueri]